MSKAPWEFHNSIEEMRKTLVALEVSLIFISSCLVSYIRFDFDFHAVFLKYPGVPKIFVYPIFWYIILYYLRAWDKSLFLNSSQYYIRVLRAGAGTLIVFATFAYLIKFPISRIWVIANVLATTFVVLAIRLLVKNQYLGKFDASQFLYLYIGKKSEQGLYLKEFSDQSGYFPRIERLDSPKKGQETKWLKEYRSKVDAHEVVGVIVGYNEITNPELFRELIDLNRDRVIDLQLISRIAPIIHRFEILESPTIVRINEPHIVASGRVIKRLFDLLLSVSLLILTFPLMLLTAILVKLTSKGPILYIDRRVGQNGEAFIFPKFRSMYKDADEKRLEILGRPDEEMLTRYKNDPRITPIGRFIRRWSIDELPQLWCVLTGTMSIVGPRPVLFEELSQIDASLNLRFIAKPGLTGLWQVSGRKEVDWEGRMLRDISYVDRWSLSQDLVLILRTIITILSGKGAF